MACQELKSTVFEIIGGSPQPLPPPLFVEGLGNKYLRTGRINSTTCQKLNEQLKTFPQIMKVVTKHDQGQDSQRFLVITYSG